MKTRKIGANYARTLTLERSSVNEEARTVEIAISSEAPVERWFGIETLGHKAGEVDLSRMQDGAPLLMDHNCRDQVGVVESVTLDKDQVLRGVVRFSKSARAQEVFQDVLDGIRTKISVGYQILAWETAKGEKGAPDQVRVTRWMPYETSFVAVPADNGVGVGRSREEDDPEPPEALDEKPEGPTNESRDLSNESKDHERSAPATITHKEPTMDPQELLALSAFAAREGVSETLNAAVAEGKSIDECRAALIRAINTKTPAVKTNAEDAKEVRKHYSVSRALAAHLSGDWSRAPFEAEVQRQWAARQANYSGGLIVPHEALRTFQGASVAADGGALVMDQFGGLVDMLRPSSVAIGGGAVVVPATGSYEIIRETGAATAYWVAEGTAPNASKFQFTKKTLTPKTLISNIPITRQMLHQSAVAFDAWVTRRILQEMALAFDAAALGAYSALTAPSGAPTGGILLDAGVPVTAFGTNGAKVSESTAALKSMKAALNRANALRGWNPSWITTPEVQGVLESVPAPGLTYAAVPYWANDRMDSMAAVSTSSLPTDLTKGTGSGLHPVILGDLAHLTVALFGDLILTLDDKSQADSGIIRVINQQMADLGLTRPTGFNVVKDAIAS